uniref:Cation efflux protein transmembrane domain-containing protein n=1 Tax=Trichobilharzia regenti TaxID=157069 RepID=A0AA85K4B1_TRIRE
MFSCLQIINVIRQDFKSARSTLSYLLSETKQLTKIETRAVRALRISFIILLCLFYLLIECNLSNSLTLTAFTHLLIFDLLSVLVALVSLWTYRKKASVESYTFGYERFEVVSVFAATILAILLSFFEIKEAVERIFEPSEIYSNHMITPCLIAFGVHLLAVYGIDNMAFTHVIQACGSSWLQEHTTDISRTICQIIPGLSRVLLPRVNPISLIGVSTTTTVCIVYFILGNMSKSSEITTPGYPDPLPDTLGAIIISLMLFGTMTPMMLYSGRILLQTTPAHLVSPLDKALREASTVDGVLELQNEHMWSIGYKNLAGSLYVRVRRDANEQLVLAHVTNRLCSLVKYLTIQVYKDDWTRATNSFIMNWTPAINHQSTLPNSSSSSGLIKTDVKSNFPLTTPTVPIQSQHPQHNHHHQQQSISSNIV